MKLNIAERIALAQLLPERAKVEQMRSIMELRQKLWFDEEEVERFGIVSTDTQTTWKVMPEGESDAVDITIGKPAAEAIEAALNTLQEKEGLRAVEVLLWDKFMSDK